MVTRSGPAETAALGGAARRTLHCQGNPRPRRFVQIGQVTKEVQYGYLIDESHVMLGSLITLSLPVAKEGSRPGLNPKPVKVTGCLQKGDEENEFVVTDKAGKKYEIKSKSVALVEHVGHTVTVEGTASLKRRRRTRQRRRRAEGRQGGSG